MSCQQFSGLGEVGRGAGAGPLSVGAAMLVYRLTLARPQRPPDPALEWLRPVVPIAYSALALVILAVILAANPMHRELRWRLDPELLPPGPYSVVVDVDRGDVDIELVETGPDQPLVEVSGAIHGFGLPQNDVHRGGEVIAGSKPVIRYRVRHIGTFTSVSGRVELRLATGDLRQLVVRTGRGNIRVGRASASIDVPELDLETGFGDVIRPERPSGAERRLPDAADDR